MTAIENMPMNDIKQLDTIKKYKAVTPTEVIIIQNFIREYIDNTCSICQGCPSQIQFAHKRLMNWAMGQKIQIEKRRMLLIEIEENAMLKKCLICGVEMTDKRKKYCKESCKDAATISK